MAPGAHDLRGARSPAAKPPSHAPHCMQACTCSPHTAHVAAGPCHQPSALSPLPLPPSLSLRVRARRARTRWRCVTPALPRWAASLTLTPRDPWHPVRARMRACMCVRAGRACMHGQCPVYIAYVVHAWSWRRPVPFPCMSHGSMRERACTQRPARTRSCFGGQWHPQNYCGPAHCLLQPTGVCTRKTLNPQPCCWWAARGCACAVQVTACR